MVYNIYKILVLSTVIVTTVCETTEKPNASSHNEEKDSSSGLKGEDIAAIILGIILICVIIATIVICILFKKGYIGEQEQTKVLPSIPEVYSTPESLREFSSAAIEKSHGKGERYDSGGSEPIIYLRDDIYHPPNSRPTAENLADLRMHRTLQQRLPKIHHHTKRSSTKKRKSSRLSRTIPDLRRTPSSECTQPYPDNSVFIAENGGMKFTMYYETQSPYDDRKRMSKTF